jgi:hypothetical protein
MTDDTITSADDLGHYRVGAIVTLKGAFKGAYRSTGHPPCGPCIDIAFHDWTETWVTLPDAASADAVTIKDGAQVTIKARVTSEDGDMEAIAIWEPGGAPIALGRETSRDVTESELP